MSEDSVEYIMRWRAPLSVAQPTEAFLVKVARDLGAQLTRIEREERGTYALMKRRKKLVAS